MFVVFFLFPNYVVHVNTSTAEILVTIKRHILAINQYGTGYVCTITALTRGVLLLTFKNLRKPVRD